MNRAGWTEVSDVLAVLRRRWDSGRFLQARARGEPWAPVVLPIKGPKADDVLHRFDEVRAWAASFVAKVPAILEVEYRQVGGRSVGTNRLPGRLRVASFDGLCTVLGTGSDVEALDALLAETRRRHPELATWAEDHPKVLLEQRDRWDRVLATVEWIASCDRSGTYLRQIDVGGVDTKFVERQQRLLSDLLPLVLPAERIDASARDFAGRFGFLAKPAYTRFRLLDLATSPFSGPSGRVSELTLRTEELAEIDLDVETVFVIENEITYLALPPVPRSVAVFGSGFASRGLAGLPWLATKEVVYWGDIDTHGFDILSRLREALPTVRSLLMDTRTLLAHRSQWTTEPNPTRRPLLHLTEGEEAVYQDLITGRHGAAVRLEQERVRFSLVSDALRPWSGRR